MFGSGLRLGVGFVNPCQSWLGSWVGVFGHGLWCCPSFAGCLWCSWLGLGFGLLMGRVWFRARSVSPPPLPVPVCGVGVRAGPGSRLCPPLLGWVVGVCFLRFFFFALWCRLLGVPIPDLVFPVPPSPFFWAGLLAPFFFCGVCLHVSVSLFPAGRCPVWCCSFWLGGPPVPLWGSCLRCLLGGGFGRLLWCWRAVWWLWAVFAPPPLPPLIFLFRGGGGGAACSSLCLPWVGARTGPHSVWSSGLLLAVAFCLGVFRPHGSGGLCTRWAPRPFLPG